MSIGSKLMVWNGSATRTSGGLTKADLMKSPRTGKIISKAQYKNGLKQAKNLGIKVGKGKGIGKLAGLMSRSQPRAGSGFLSDALGSIGLGIKRKRRVTKRKGAGLKKKKRTVKRKGGYVARGGYVSRGGKRKAPKRRGRKAKGSGAFDDFMTGFTAPIKVASSLAPMARFFL